MWSLFFGKAAPGCKSNGSRATMHLTLILATTEPMVENQSMYQKMGYKTVGR